MYTGLTEVINKNNEINFNGRIVNKKKTCVKFHNSFLSKQIKQMEIQ